MKRFIRRLTESAILIAIAFVLSYFKIDLPFGGGVTICSMLPIILISYRYGWIWGTFSAFAYSLLQLIQGMDNLKYGTTIPLLLGIILLDYIAPYTLLGLSGLFSRIMKNNRVALFVGIVIAFAMRFLCHFITGAWIWQVWMPDSFMGMPMTNPWIYSFLYNGWYMLAELIITETVAMLIYKRLGKYFRGEDLH